MNDPCAEVSSEDLREIHPTHDPEPPDVSHIYTQGVACRRCCWFVAFETPTYRVTDRGAAPCKPTRVELR